MQAQRQQLWNLYVHARAKGFHFKLKATDILPAGKFFQFSILLKLWPFRIEVKLEPTKQKSLESKFLQFLKKFRVRRADNKAIAARKTLNSGRSSRFAYVVGQRSVFIGNLALLCQSISEKDQKGIILHGSIVFLCFASILENLFGRKTCVFLGILSFSMVGYSMWCSK
ncbi:unnamed protein product [Ilex paraguariensis]|uniref:Uncharacterized protein n=1 Tax=Ilex paraguariensis TaxID=185542 RepID=A0ABC8RHL9_9AQUA